MPEHRWAFDWKRVMFWWKKLNYRKLLTYSDHHTGAWMVHWVFKTCFRVSRCQKKLFLKAMLSNSRILYIDYNLASYITRWVLIVNILFFVWIFLFYLRVVMFSVISACFRIPSLYNFSALSFFALVSRLKKKKATSPVDVAN